jgi:hypothetical protein
MILSFSQKGVERKDTADFLNDGSPRSFLMISLVSVSARDRGDRGISSVLTLEEIYGRSVSGWQTA